MSILITEKERDIIVEALEELIRWDEGYWGDSDPEVIQLCKQLKEREIK